MSIDPFLFAHKVGEFHINIGGQWSPLSIRDQMLRGQWAAERALESNLLGEGEELAIIGAGVGGVTAAMVAVNAGVKVTLFDRDSDPFSRHIRCGRWVDPTQYDWPLDHFTVGSIPLTLSASLPPTPPATYMTTTPSVPLKWPRANQAFALVGDWISQFGTFKHTPNATTYFTWRGGCEVTKIQPDASGALAEVTWNHVASTGSSSVNKFGLVISAMGFGEERNYLEFPKGIIFPSRGYPFWDNDPFENPGLTWSGPIGRPQVLISGGGDGALQDLIRIATRFKSSVDLWNHLPFTDAQSAAIRKAVQDLEDQASRSLLWSAGSTHDHAILERLMVGLTALVDQVRRWPRVKAAITSAVRKDYLRLWLVHSCSHFNPSYSMNRFLSLLLIQQLPEEGINFKYLPKHRLVHLDCTHGTPALPDPTACHLQVHKATFAPHSDCRSSAPSSTTSAFIEKEFNVLVLRHGIEPPPLHLLGGTAATAMPSRQALPYYYPG